MPAWAQDNPEEYWDAADLYERANGRLFVSADSALPRGLDLADQIILAHEFAQELTRPASWSCSCMSLSRESRLADNSFCSSWMMFVA
jgi:hypothetical protein